MKGVQTLKRIIDGKTYNTDTSTKIASASWGAVPETTDGVLYQTRGGAFFVHECFKTSYRAEEGWKTKTDDKFDILTAEQAHAWVMEGEVEILDEAFETPPEAEAEDPAKPEATLYIRVPVSLKTRIDAAAKNAGQSANAWSMKCMEQCLDNLRQERAEVT